MWGSLIWGQDTTVLRTDGRWFRSKLHRFVDRRDSYLGDCLTLIFRSPYVDHHCHYYPIGERKIKVSHCSLTWNLYFIFIPSETVSDHLADRSQPTGGAVELVRNLVAHGDARKKWRGNWRMECVASSLTPPPNVVYPALLKLMRKPRLPAVDWTDPPTDLNGLVRFGERRNLFSARVASCSARAIVQSYES